MTASTSPLMVAPLPQTLCERWRRKRVSYRYCLFCLRTATIPVLSRIHDLLAFG